MRSAGRHAARLLLALSILASPPSQARAADPAKEPLPDFDASGGLRTEGPSHAPLSAAQRAALSELRRVTRGGLRVRLNASTHTPRVLAAGGPLSPPASGDAEGIARSFLHVRKDLWGLSDAEIDRLEPDARYTDAHTGITHVFYRQMVAGVPIFPAGLAVHVDGKGQVASVHGDLFPGIRAVARGRLSAEDAASFAADHVGVRYSGRQLGTDGDVAVLEAAEFESPIRATRTIYALGSAPRPAYRMLLHKNGLEWYDVIVDADDGRLLNRRNLFQTSGQLTPSAPAEASPAAPRGLVFVEHPLATVRGTGDVNRRYPYTVDPSGQPRGFASAPLFGASAGAVISHGGDPANASVAQILLPLPTAAAPSRSSSLPLGTSPQSPQGWFIPQAGHYITFGNNVDAKDDQAADDEGSIGAHADGGLTGDFGTSAFVFQNHYGKNGPYANTSDGQAAAAQDWNPVILNLFYMSNWYHDFLYHLGFTEPAGNFQLDNFGRGGRGGDYVFADAQDGSGTNNSNFGTPPDGSNPRMQMFLFTGPERDGSLDGDVMLHEYTHGLSNRLVGGPNDTSCLGQGLVGESSGMGEGWSDWYAAMVMDEPVIGEYAVNNPASGVRRFPMNAGPGDFTYGFLCTGPPSNPSLVPCEAHDIGEFWSIVLWEMREAMINRFHNRALPASPYPTFNLPAGDPTSNIQQARGRTFDGSNDAAQIDRASIESATFQALFTVTDGLKMTVCNPTIVDARDAILAADRATGGEFQDLIWRAFANRGIGSAATTTGPDVPATVEDFTVPATVDACEAAGGPLAAPSFTVVSTAANTATVSITPDGAADHVVYRGTDGAGTAIDPKLFVEVGRTTSLTFVDAGLNGGTTYHYRVRALRNDDCVSAGVDRSVVPLGAALPCTTPPAFLGVTRALDAGDCSHVLLDWSPARSSCVAGPGVAYNVYRSASAGFTPSAATRIATGVAGASFVDTPGSGGTVFHYVVRAEDSTTGHGGPANGGNEDVNTADASALVTSGALVNQGFSDDVEQGPDSGKSAHFTSSGLSIPMIAQRGGWFRDAAPSPALAHSGATVWHTFDPDNQPISATQTRLFELTSDVVTVTPSTIMTFFHTFASEASFDGGVVEAAPVDATTGVTGAFQDIGDLIYENGYNGVMNGEDAPGASTNPLFGRRGYTGGVLGSMKRVRAFLGALVPPGQASQKVIVRFLFGSDIANQISTSPTPEGTYNPGWYIDDISLDESCCPVSPAPGGLTAAATGDHEITLRWSAPAGAAPSQYLIFREESGDATPQVFEDQIASVPGSQTTFVDRQLVPDVTYRYVIRAKSSAGCPSAQGNVAEATATGTCAADPAFAGVKSVGATPQAGCALDLTWDPGFAGCPGASVRYNVYRGTEPAITPSLDNAIALGVTGETFHDQSGLSSGVTYYYVVRAEDTTTGGDGPANGGNEDGNLVRKSASPLGSLGPGPDFSDDVEPSPESGYTTFSTRTAGGWAAMTDPTAHSLTHAWVALDDQPGAPTLTSKDDRLTLPAMSLSSTSRMTFFHNYDFARFPLSGPDAAFQSGGVLEISADGASWIDLGPYIVSGGYTGVIAAGATNPMKSRAAWVGSSDGGANSPVPGRADAMQQVVVDLGAALLDPAGPFRTTVLPQAHIRFRLGGTYQLLIGGVQGAGWGIDDIRVSELLVPGTCSTSQPPRCSITGVSPGTARQGQTVTVTIAGSGFAAGSSAAFSQGGDASDGIDEGPSTVNASGTAVTLQAAISSSAPEGPHDVAVIAPDGSFCVDRSAFVVTRAGGGGSSRVIPCDDPSISRKGGWHQIADARSSFGQYCRNVGANKGNAPAFLELAIQSNNGGTVSVIYAKGPRGGDASAVEGGVTRTLDFYRTPADPAHPDASGRGDLTFGFSETYAVPPGGGTLRIDVLNDGPQSDRNMAYLEGMIFTEAQQPSSAGRYQEPESAAGGTIPAGGSATRSYASPLGSVMLTVLAEAIQLQDLSLSVINPLGVTVASVDTAMSPEIAQTLSVMPGVYTIRITNKSASAAPYSVYVIPTVDSSAATSSTGGGGGGGGANRLPARTP